MSSDILQQIRDLQMTDQEQAESLLLAFVNDQLGLDVISLHLTPLAVSLNSFNGFMTLADGRHLFFKSHTESDTVIGEYYNAEMLAQIGYPVIQPVYKSTEAGRQFLAYEVISDPSVFDLAWSIEQEDRDFEALRQAQVRSDEQLLALYRASLHTQSAEDAQKAPVHQLFHHRLTGGRLERFYGPLPGEAGADVLIQLPAGQFPMSDVRRVKWIINGQRYDETLDDIITRALDLLQPGQSGPAVTGHGDAHNGNVFFQGETEPPSLLYFDPAFAGAHHPLLDLTKPLFHNVFAMWMYYPREKRDQTAISMLADGDHWTISYHYELHPVRLMFLRSKVEHTLIPVLRDLASRGQLRPDWRAYLKASLFCCPFLTMNLADAERFPPEISLLGLVMAVEMGAESQTIRSLIDRTLDEVAAALSDLL